MNYYLIGGRHPQSPIFLMAYDDDDYGDDILKK
jgi:hypothetical protein